MLLGPESTPDLSSDAYWLPLQTSATTSTVVAILYTVAYALPPLFSLALYFAFRRRARLQREVFEGARKGRAGALVCGIVQCDAADQIAAQVTIHQHHEYVTPSKGKPYWRWKETHRTTRAVPFELVPDEGAPLHVEVGESPSVVAELSIGPGDPYRQQEATIRSGQRVFVEGLRRGGSSGGLAYRGGEERPTIEPAPGGSIMLATDAALGRFDARIRACRWTAAVGAAAWLVIVLVAVAPWFCAAQLGRHEIAVVEDVTGQNTKSGVAWSAKVRTPSGHTFTDSIDASTRAAIVAQRDAGKTVRVPVVYSFYPWSGAIGPHSTLGPGFGFFFWPALPFIVAMVHWAWRRRRPWYEGAKLDE